MKFLPLANVDVLPTQLIDLPAAAGKLAPIEAALAAIRDIVATHPAPYTLMLSGGVDSQAMLWAWYLSGIPFSGLTVTYDSYNQHDLETLQEFMQANSISAEISSRNFDIINFVEHDLPEYADRFKCSSPQICTHMKISEMVSDGTVIFSGNFISSPDRGGPSLSYAILGISRFADAVGKSLIPFFFMHTPELAYSFLEYAAKTTGNAYESKVETYQIAGFPVIAQNNKYTGFEKIKDHYDQFADRVPTQTRLEFSSKASKRTFDLLFRYPFEKKINDPHIEYIYSFLKDQTQ